MKFHVQPQPLPQPAEKVATTLREMRERHEERHRPSGFHFAFADRIDFLNEAAWDAVAANGSLFLRRDVLRDIEQPGPDNGSPGYFPSILPVGDDVRSL